MAGTQLPNTLGERVLVNSCRHQAVDRIDDGLVCTSTDPMFCWITERCQTVMKREDRCAVT